MDQPRGDDALAAVCPGLCDRAIREHFIECLFAHRRLRQLLARPLRTPDLVRFHTRHKLLLLAHSPAAYAELGRLVAGARSASVAAAAADYRRIFMSAMSAMPSRGRHANVLQHIAGYFRPVLSSGARRDLAMTIEDYQRGLVPLVVPVRLLAHYARLHELRYLLEQFYLDPHPKELMPRNHA